MEWVNMRARFFLDFWGIRLNYVDIHKINFSDISFGLSDNFPRGGDFFIGSALAPGPMKSLP